MQKTVANEQRFCAIYVLNDSRERMARKRGLGSGCVEKPLPLLENPSLELGHVTWSSEKRDGTIETRNAVFVVYTFHANHVFSAASQTTVRCHTMRGRRSLCQYMASMGTSYADQTADRIDTSRAASGRCQILLFQSRE